MKLHKLSAVLMAGAAASTLLLSATAAGAAVAQPHGHTGGGATKSAPVLPASRVLPTTLPKGYTLVTSDFIAFAGVLDADSAQCPGTEQPVGGGAFVSSSDVGVNLHSSYPDGGWWTVTVSNASATSTDVTAYAICMAYSPYYRVVSAQATVNPESVNSQAVVCPAHTSVTGGGAYVPPVMDVNINSTVPNTFAGGHTGWRAAVASSDSSPTTFTMYAACRPKPAGYSIQWGPLQQLGTYTEGAASVTCPGASVPIGGGGFTGYMTGDSGINMNSSGPYGQGWVVYENNAEAVVRSLGAAAICAGT